MLPLIISLGSVFWLIECIIFLNTVFDKLFYTLMLYSYLKIEIGGIGVEKGNQRK